VSGPIRWEERAEVGDFLVRSALEEDAACRDAATAALGNSGLRMHVASVVAREDLVVCGWFLVEAVYRILEEDCGFAAARTEQLVPDGAPVSAGSVLGMVTGPADSLLRGERVAVNLLSRLSGIATLTRRFVQAVEGTGVEILDTRKTTPCHRALDRYAVRTGGGINHRFDLAVMAMIKDNHLAAAGGTGALPGLMTRLRDAGVPVEIEVDSLEQLEKVLPLRPDRILLDNMTPGLLRLAVAMASDSGCYLEASGGVTLDSVREIASTGVHGISSGALTHSAAWADVGLDWRSG
jgi:nicotinate-nucleotide pyrophosphorylase (carboxylating)